MEPHGGQWVCVYRAMGSLVYDGSAGIGLYLARLARVSGDAIIRATAEAATGAGAECERFTRSHGRIRFLLGPVGHRLGLRRGWEGARSMKG